MPDTTTHTAAGGQQIDHGRGRAYDASDPRHGGLPAWPVTAVPRHLHTRRQLTNRGLRPGRQTVAGLVFWDGSAGLRCARLYDATQAQPRLARLPRRPRRPAGRLSGELHLAADETTACPRIRFTAPVPAAADGTVTTGTG